MPRILLVFAALSFLWAFDAQGCSTQIEWDGPTRFRAVADGCDGPGGPFAFRFGAGFQYNFVEDQCIYDQQPCQGSWVFVLSCTPPGDYVASSWVDHGASAYDDFTVPQTASPKVILGQPYKPAGSPWKLPVTLELPLWGTSEIECPRVYKQESGGTTFRTIWCPADGSFSLEPGTTSQFDVTLSGTMAPSAANYTVLFARCDGSFAKDTVVMDKDDPSCDVCPSCIGDPVRTSNGNMRYTETDLLPGDSVEPFVRTYNSRLGYGWFAHAWASPLDARAVAGTLVTGDNNRGLVTIRAAKGDSFVFALEQGVYEQLSPSGTARSRLRYDGTSFVFERYGSRVAAIFSATTGRITAYRDTSTGRETRVTYNTSGQPTRVSDSWGNWAWTVTVDAASGYITRIGKEGSSQGPYLTYHYASSGFFTDLTEVRSSASTSTPVRKYQYGSSGGLTTAMDGSGRILESHAYSPSDPTQASTSLGPSGDLASIQYDQPGRVPGERMTRATTLAGATSEYYLRQVRGRWKTVEIIGTCSTCDLSNTVYGYDGDGNLTHEQDARGFVTVKTYDPSGRVIAEEGPFLRAGCNADDPLCRFTADDITSGALSPTTRTRSRTYTYDGVWPDRLTATGTASAYASGEQQSQFWTYAPGTGNVLSVESAGWTDIPARLESRRTTNTPYNGVEGAAFNPGGTFNSKWLTLPQPAGFIKTADGPRTDVADVTTYVYFPTDSTVTAGLRGRLAATKTADGSVVRVESYDSFGNALRRVDQNGTPTDYTYDALGRIKTAIVRGTRGCDTAADPLCAADLTTTYTYDAATGPLRTVTTPTGGVTQYDYDSRGRRIAESRGPAATDLRERQLFEYDDSSGRIRQTSLQAYVGGTWVTKRSERNAFDREGRLWRTFAPPYTVPETNGVHVEFGYDAAGNLRTVKDERHSAANTEYVLDPEGAIAEARQLLGSRWIATRYEHDGNGNVLSVTDPNLNQTTYAVDDFGQVLRTVSPVTGTSSTAYDVAGNPVQHTDARGAVATHSYDAANRITQSVHTHSSGNETITRTYDDPTANRYAKGRLSSLTDPSGTTQLSYERRGLLRREERTVAGTALVTQYRYDAAGSRSGITYPSGRIATYTLDYAGRPVSVTGKSPTGVNETYATAAAYQPFGPLSGFTFGNGLTLQAAYDDRYRPATRALMNGAVAVASTGYTHDAGTNILALTDNVAAGYTRTFQYDDLSRLTVANCPALWGAGSYDYDDMGNMLVGRLGSATRTFTLAGASPLLGSVSDENGVQSPSYDLAGNLTSAFASDSRAYSARDLLRTRTLGGTLLAYDYDGRNVRVSSTRTVSGATTRMRMVYDADLQLLESRTDAGTPSDVIRLDGVPIAQATGAVVLYTHTDHLGTPILQASQTKVVIWRAEYEPFGTIYQMRAGTPADQPLRFPGQEAHDGGGDESYNIFRWYRSGWGRYTQPDPAGLQAGPNLFSYVLDNPIALVDPFGLKAELVCKNVGTGGTPIPLSRHCRLRVNCTNCPGQPAKVDVTVGMEFTGKPKYSINEWPYPKGLQGYHETWPVVYAAKECDFTKCVRAYNKLFSKGYTGQTTKYVPAYGILGPNSNTYAARLIETCGGAGIFPFGAVGAPGALGSSDLPPALP